MFVSMRIPGFRTFLYTYSGHIILSFIRTQPCVKHKPLKTEKLPEPSHSVLGRFYCNYIPETNHVSGVHKFQILCDYNLWYM
jgi:hypothetical protein